MDDDYDDFFRQDISEGKDDDEDKDIPSVSLFLKILHYFLCHLLICIYYFYIEVPSHLGLSREHEGSGER